jgi:ribosomal protein S18 acetylase RimI-like enzyme
LDELASQGGESDVTIRRATAADVDAFTAFGARTFFEAFAGDNTPEDMRLHLEKAWRPELQAAEISDPSFDTLLACDAQGTFAGFAQLRAGRAPPNVPASDPIELWRFYVDRPWQGCGVAQQLMAAAIRRAHERGGRSLWLGVFERNQRAQAFYRKSGFRPVGSQTFIVGTDPQRDVVMLRDLP